MLELKNLKKSYLLPDGEDLPILEISHWSVEAGEQVVVVGASGCGKTTLLHIIAGILRPSSGHVLIDGWDTPILTEAERDQFRARRIGYVFQTFNLLQGFTALENVMIGMTFAGTRSDRHRAKDLLEKVGLGHRLHHKPAQLSVGEQQRVSVARALANKPKLVLADEPTANVDVGNQQQVIDMLRNTCEEEHVALILVTHAPEVADQFKRVDKLVEINLVVSKRKEQKNEEISEKSEELNDN
ncbi:MAG: ABC transporter ATP-binding protein [Planctomycetaceae bacterium]|jgi:putative ABC transport system ATP-binding protein|nr:ABC transporter ATP-binding protein [Planctomycetaceae bacterium]